MSSSRKIRFIIIMLFVVVANGAIWFVHRFYGLSIKQMGGYFGFVGIIDLTLLFCFAGLGVLTSYLLAFKPDALKKSIERSMAKQAARGIPN